MGVFDDKEYEKLDWISQAVEPIKSPMNDLLAQLPDEVIIDYKAYSSFRESSYSVGFNVMDVVLVLAKRLKFEVSYDDRSLLGHCFKFEMSNGTEIDFEKKKITGDLKLVKIKSQFDDRELEKSLGSKGLSCLDRQLSNYKDDSVMDMGKLNDIIDILDANHETRHSRSYRKKVKAIKAITHSIFRENKWKIEDSGLADRFCDWIISYVNNGNIAAYANICRLKLMTHKGLPIYSMLEDAT